MLFTYGNYSGIGLFMIFFEKNASNQCRRRGEGQTGIKNTKNAGFCWAFVSSANFFSWFY